MKADEATKAEEAKAVTVKCVYPDKVPVDEISYLVAVLRRRQPVDFAQGFRAAYVVIGFLGGKFLGEVSTKAVAEKKVSAKVLADTLESFLPDGPQVAPKAVGAFLVPILIELALKWVRNKK